MGKIGRLGDDIGCCAVDEENIDLSRSVSSDRFPHQPLGPDLDDGVAVDGAEIVDLEQTGQIGARSGQGGCGRGCVQKDDEAWDERVVACFEGRRRLVHESRGIPSILADQGVGHSRAGVEDEVEDPAGTVHSDYVASVRVEDLSRDRRHAGRSRCHVVREHCAVHALRCCWGNRVGGSIGDGEWDSDDIGDKAV